MPYQDFCERMTWVYEEAILWGTIPPNEYILPFLGVSTSLFVNRKYGPIPCLVSPWLERGNIYNQRRHWYTVEDKDGPDTEETANDPQSEDLKPLSELIATLNKLVRVVSSQPSTH